MTVHQPRPVRHVSRGSTRFTLIPNDEHTVRVLQRRRQLSIGEDYRVAGEEDPSPSVN